MNSEDKIRNLSISEAVDDPEWQEFRLSLKGLSTSEKLAQLSRYQSAHRTERARIQVQNYINALKRGGQLNIDGTIKKE